LREKEKNILERNWMRGGEICILVLGAVVVIVVVVVVVVVLQRPRLDSHGFSRSGERV